MEKLKIEECKKCEDWNGSIVNCMNICGKPIDALEEFNRYKCLEEQGKFPYAMRESEYIKKEAGNE